MRQPPECKHIYNKPHIKHKLYTCLNDQNIVEQVHAFLYKTTTMKFYTIGHYIMLGIKKKNSEEKPHPKHNQQAITQINEQQYIEHDRQH